MAETGNPLSQALRVLLDRYSSGLIAVPGEARKLAQQGVEEAFVDIPQRAVRAGGVYGDPRSTEAEKTQAVGDIAMGALEYGAAGSVVPRPANSLGIFGGVNAKTADHKALARAQEMADAGMGRNDIWSETGWFEGRDGAWRFEIDDSQMGVTPPRDQAKGAPLYKVVQHREFSKAYPELTMDTEVVGGTPSLSAYTTESAPGTVFRELSTDYSPSATLHEIQHAVQQVEDFAPGGTSRTVAPWYRSLLDDKLKLVGAVDNDLARFREVYGRDPEPGVADMFNDYSVSELASERRGLNDRPGTAFKAYQNLAGEVEARNVQARMGMDKKQRKAKPPWETQDRTDEEQLIMPRRRR